MEIRKVIDAKHVKASDIPQLRFSMPKRDRRKHKTKFYDNICAFDIETSVVPDLQQAVMYVWQFAIDDVVIIGRTWEEFKQFLQLMNKKAGRVKKLLCFVHNLSFEFQFLSGVFDFSNDDVFCTEPRKILYAKLGCLEFRCSYLLSNMSLDAMTSKFNVDHKKLSGVVFDYSKTRYPWTELTDYEIRYIINDVIGLIESIQALMELYNDTVHSLPLTSTGYVRRIVKDRMRPYHKKITEIYPDIEVYKMLLQEFRGGNTHANRFYAEDIIDTLGNSYDISSSYPSAQCNRLYPMTAFQPIKNISADKIDKLISYNYAILFEIEFFDIKLRNRYFPVPYIPIAKCSALQNYVNDNGRVLRASYCRMVLTDIDWKIIVEEYTFSCTVIRGYKSHYAPLPDPIIKSNTEFFRNKTELKGVAGQELYYMKSKNLLNSIYGMSCQRPTKRMILFDECQYTEDNSKTLSELLQESKRRAFMVYQWSCWTTAHARAALEEGIKLAGDNLLYVDTDSVKVIGELDFSEYNNKQKQLSEKSGLFAADPAGTVHYGGLFEFDGSFAQFITLGAKKYCYVDMSGKLHLTLSGVAKKPGEQYLLEHGGITAFKRGCVFPNCGKTESKYFDAGAGYCIIDGHELDITRNVVIKDQEYTLSITRSYDDIIRSSKAELYKIMQLFKNTMGIENFEK